ncbi:MAG: hypothetical protein ABWY37_08705 [Microbacterium pygmaeum]
MNTSLAPVRSLDSDTLHLPAAAERARLSFTDRLELRVGLWLLLRSARRYDVAGDHRDHVRRESNSRARAAREHAALRAHSLGTVRT